MGKTYTNSNLIRYGETIQLHFDQTGKIAWLTLKNYGYVFGTQPFDAVKQATIGIPAGDGPRPLSRDQQSEYNKFAQDHGFKPGELKPLGRPISIGAMLDAIDVIKFQVAILTSYYDTPRTSRGFARGELYKLIEKVFQTLGVQEPHTIVYKEKDESFHWNTYMSLRKILTKPPGALAVYDAIRAYNSQKTGLTAYFPEPSLIPEEQRTKLNLFKKGSGKTVGEDTRDIEPLLSPSYKPYDPFEDNAPFNFNEFIAMVDEDIRELRAKGGYPEDSLLHPKDSPRTARYLHKHIQTVCCFGFRGDDRDPAEIKKAGGFLPGVTRKDEGVAKFKDIAGEIDAALKKGGEEYLEVMKKLNILHLGVYTREETSKFKGYTSVTTSTAIAKYFANRDTEELTSRTYCYAVRCRGGFYLPTPVRENKGWWKGLDTWHTFIHLAEQEVAVPGAIWWDNDIVGARVIRCDKNGQFFFGPVFLKDQLKREDNGAFSALFELFSGKSQGEGFQFGQIEKSYPQTPFTCRVARSNDETSDSASEAPAVTLSLTSLTFSNQAVGTPSAAQNVTLFNDGNAPLSITNTKLTGENPDNFTRQTEVNAPSVPPSQSCTIRVTFTPTAIGNRTATLEISHNASGSPHNVTLTGAGVSPVILSPDSLTFGDQAVGTSAVKNLTLTNRGNAPLSTVTIRRAGPDGGDFAETRAFGSVPVNESRTISVTFTPTSTGERTGTLEVSYSASDPPLTARLIGTGVVAALSATSLAFSYQALGTSSAAREVRLTNPGKAPLSITDIKIIGANPGDFEFVSGSRNLQAGESCTISVIFTPKAIGERTGTLEISHNASGSPQRVTLTGTGVRPMEHSPVRLTFGDQAVGTSADKNLTLTNRGNAPLSVTDIKPTGANPDNFTLASSSGFSVQPGQSCIISVTFTPTAIGNRTAILEISHNASGSPHRVPLTGSGVHPVKLSAAKVTFGDQAVGTKSDPEEVTVTSKVPLSNLNIEVTGPNSDDFSHDFRETYNRSMKAGERLTIKITFTPTGSGNRTGTLKISHDASGSPQTVSLTGTGVPPVTLSTDQLTFGNQAVGTTSAAQIVTFTNHCKVALSNVRVSITGWKHDDFKEAHTFGSSVRAGDTCTISITFTPTESVNRTGTLRIYYNASGSPHMVSLSGTGV
jgi:hypothetical protein